MWGAVVTCRRVENVEVLENVTAELRVNKLVIKVHNWTGYSSFRV